MPLSSFRIGWGLRISESAAERYRKGAYTDYVRLMDVALVISLPPLFRVALRSLCLRTMCYRSKIGMIKVE